MLNQSDIDALRHTALPTQKLFIDGEWRNAAKGHTLDVVSPIDGSVISHLAAATEADVDLAVAAARRSFDRGHWSRAAPSERKKVMLRIADLIQQHALELSVLGVRDNGTEINMAYKAEPGSAAETFRYYAECIDKVYGEIAPTADNRLGLIHREAVGVVAAIVPWNFPLMIAAWKIAPALATGNSVVLKPSEEASLSLLRVAELCAEAGLPEGVLNVITGYGHTAGEALGLHPEVDVMVFTGSGGVGRKLLEYSARSNLKRVYLELGGKSPNIVFDDAPDLQQAVKTSIAGMFRNSGQVCIAGSRLLVQRSVYADFVDALRAQASELRVGDPLDLRHNVGAIASQRQWQKNLSFVAQAVEEGATLASGGEALHAETGGFYMQPTLFTDVQPHMTLAREEVFGPVLSVLPFEDEHEALTLANDSVYGLSSAIWSRDLSRVHRVMRGLNAGVVHVNCYGGADISMPLGGVKQSGNGVDKSLHSLEKYTNLKSAWVAL